MEPASFLVQVFFENVVITESPTCEFSIRFRLFHLPIVDVTRKTRRPGRWDLSIGKRLTLRMPALGIFSDCPMLLLFHTRSSRRESKSSCQLTLNLQPLFTSAIRSPRCPIRQHLSERLTGLTGEHLADLEFSVTVCFGIGDQGEVTSSAPIEIPSKSPSPPSPTTERVGPKTGVVLGALYPNMTPTRQRSISYFNKEELTEENRILSERLADLTDVVRELKDVMHMMQIDLGTPRPRAAPLHRTADVYHPPGLERAPRGQRRMSLSGPSFTVVRQFKRR
jgi:hypothetical protein